MQVKTVFRTFGLTTLIILLAAGWSLAAQGPITPGQYQLGEMVVRADKAGVESVGTVRQVTAQQIEAMGARTLDQALKLVPGVNVRMGSGGVPRIDIRGFRSRHVLILLNGVPFNSTYDGQFDPSLIPTENIARIKVSYGAHSVLYGQGGLAGVIDIITKAGKKGLGGKIKGEAGTGDSYLGAFSLYGGNDKTDFFASGSWYQRDNWQVSEGFDETSEQGSGARVGTDKKRGNLFANMQYSPSDPWMLGFSVGVNNGEYGIPPSSINDKKDDFAKSPKYERVEDIKGFFGQASLSYQGQGPLSFRGWVFANRLEDSSKRFDDANFNSMDDATVKSFDLDQTTDVLGVNVQAAYDLKRWGLLTLGLIAENDDWKESGRIRDARIGKTKKYDWRGLDDSKDVNIYSAALEYEVPIVTNLELVLGYGHNWQDRSEGDTEGGNMLAGLNWTLRQGTNLRGSYAHNVRFPSIRQLYDSDNGNTELEPEETDTFELGIDQELPFNSVVSLTGYHIMAKDYIERDGDSIFQNNDKYRFQGFELTGETRPFEGLWIMAGYTFLDTKDQSSGAGKDELQNRPRHKLILQGKYTLPFGLSLYLGFQYLADTYYYSQDEPLQKGEYGNYALVDAKIAQSLLDDRLKIYLGADNLLDKSYQESYGYPAEGRFVYIGAEASF